MYGMVAVADNYKTTTMYLFDEERQTGNTLGKSQNNYKEL
jgi:hypothetical protein